jgi:hypothetical protein
LKRPGLTLLALLRYQHMLMITKYGAIQPLSLLRVLTLKAMNSTTNHMKSDGLPSMM